MTTVIRIGGKGESSEPYADGRAPGAMHVHTGPTSSGPSARGPPSKAVLGLCGFLAVISLGLIIVGAVIPGVVDTMITNGVRDNVSLDTRRMDADAQKRFLNGSTPMHFHLYNCTNLKAALSDPTIPLNFDTVGPLKLLRYAAKYDVEYSPDRSIVAYKQYVTFDVDTSDAHTVNMMERPIVGINPLFFGAGAQIMQQAHLAAKGKLSSRFEVTGLNELSEQLTTFGFWGGQVLPKLLPQFTSVESSDLLALFMLLFLPNYLKYAEAVAAVLTSLGAPNLTPSEVRLQWAEGLTNLYTHVSTTATPFAPESFHHFDLGPYKLNSTDKQGIADKLFDATHPYGIASAAALTDKWVPNMFAFYMGVPTPARTEFAAALGMDKPDDVSRVARWILTRLPSKFTLLGESIDNPLYGVVADRPYLTVSAASYEYGCSAALAAKVSELTTAPSPFASTMFGVMYANDPPAYVPNSWTDLGALQFSTGLVVGMSLSSVSMLTTGMGESMRTALGGDVTGASAPLNFANLATETWGGVEPPEFYAGIQYVLQHGTDDQFYNGVMAYAPELLYVQDSGHVGQNTTVRTPSIAQTKQLLVTLSNPTKLGNAFGALATVAGGVVKSYMEGGGVPEAAGVVAFLFAADTTAAARDAGATADNWFAYYTYLVYITHELAGPKSLLNGLGVSPQNAGMFSVKSVGDLLFGYTARFITVPGVAGIRTNWTGFDANIAADRLTKNGRDVAQYTGEGDLDDTGKFVAYNGYDKYETYCDLYDPARTGMGSVTVGGTTFSCAIPATLGVINDRITIGPVQVAGAGDGLAQPPFTEGDKRPDMYSLYVDEAKRVLPLVYKEEVNVKDIDLRRYVVGTDCLMGDNPWRNFTQLRFDAQQVPEGFTSVQSVNGGLPLLLGLPRFGPVVSDNFTGGITCTGLDGVPGQRCADTYDIQEHGTFIDVEPITGLTMRASKRIQGNFRVTKHEYYTDLTDLATKPQGVSTHYNNLFVNRDLIVLPYYWADLNDIVTDDLAEKFRDSKKTIDMGRTMGEAIEIAGLTVGSVGLVACIGSIIYLLKRK